MIPRLQCFYKGEPDSWLRIPRVLLSAYVRMLPRLEAQQEMRMVRACSSPYLEQADRKKYLGELEREQHGGKKRPIQQVNLAQLAMAGVTVREVK